MNGRRGGVNGCFHEVHSFLIKSTSKGIIPLIPWSLTKEINIKSIINTLMLFFTVKIVSFSQEAAEWTI